MIGKSIISKPSPRIKSSSILSKNNSSLKAKNAIVLIKKHGKKLCNGNYKDLNFITRQNPQTGQHIILTNSDNKYMILTSAGSQAEAKEIIGKIEGLI